MASNMGLGFPLLSSLPAVSKGVAQQGTTAALLQRPDLPIKRQQASFTRLVFTLPGHVIPPC